MGDLFAGQSTPAIGFQVQVRPEQLQGPNRVPVLRWSRARVRAGDFPGPPDSTSEWRIRVIQNMYPALSRQLDFTDGESDGGSTAMPGFGFHDVVIESPAHRVHLEDNSPAEIADVLLAYSQRIEQIREFDSIKYVQVFKNHGASAGASMSHPHSQIMALPVIPSTVSARLNSMKEYFVQTGNCCVCQVKRDDLLIDESSHFMSVAPFASTFPFEIWVVPRDHSSHFHVLDLEKALDLAGLLKLILIKMSLQLKDPPYNLMLHTAPLQVDSSDLPFTHWFIQIVPQLTQTGGFELGTGCYINPVFPEDAAKVLREVRVPNQL
ncbi:putative galactose-1-phosphate uridyl transferase-like [Dorcoceras hygrometricum]|uniref:Putative galactose-1-phosphate uridyl transferase-like n=1 Tax=Dorcoceras hygrometricum TaxID=472368 RepID=A0A2Z7DDR5_9LAMI|nr:putative galactose-1-phosphate uridyl transferase-like [Dorcoceras hygrometricum]